VIHKEGVKKAVLLEVAKNEPPRGDSFQTWRKEIGAVEDFEEGKEKHTLKDSTGDEAKELGPAPWRSRRAEVLMGKPKSESLEGGNAISTSNSVKQPRDIDEHVQIRRDRRERKSTTKKRQTDLLKVGK